MVECNVCGVKVPHSPLGTVWTNGKPLTIFIVSKPMMMTFPTNRRMYSSSSKVWVAGDIVRLVAGYAALIDHPLQGATVAEAVVIDLGGNAA